MEWFIKKVQQALRKSIVLALANGVLIGGQLEGIGANSYPFLLGKGCF
jgi:hypothetical protein